MRNPLARRALPLNHIGLLAALVAAVYLVGSVAPDQPRATLAVAAILVVVELGLFWLAKHFHARALIGGLLFLTVLRPLPNLGNPFLVGRAIDLLWLVLAFLVLMLITDVGRRLSRGWRGAYWLLAMTAAVLVSLSTGAYLLGQPIITRDLFELYRGPYYFLILLIATQVRWSDRQLTSYFFKPFVVALWIAFAVSLVQGLGPDLVQYVYTPKATQSILIAINEGTYVRNSGTFANPNWYGVALAVTLPFLLAGHSIVGHPRFRILIWLTSVSALLFLGISGSRTGLAAGVVAVAGYFLWSLWDARKRSLRLQRVRGRYVSRAFMGLFLFVTVVLLLTFVSRGVRFSEVLTALSEGSLLGIDSVAHKWSSATALVRETLERSPLFGFGPSKEISQLLGDNQYSVLIYRYGLFGLTAWFGFWTAVFWHALRLKRRAQTALQANMARAVLAAVPAFVLAGFGGAFFDATQIATLFLLLIGIAFSARGLEERLPVSGPSPSFSSGRQWSRW